MSVKMENTLRESQLAVIGKLLAGYTHELKNHLAIINESNGLMGDLLDMTEGEDDQTRLRFKKIIVTIGERISQANTMAMYLNSFAHRMDTPLSNFDVNDLLIEELALIDRVARLNNIQIKQNLQDDMPSVFNNPSLFQFAIFTFIHELIGKLSDGDVIEISSLVKNQMIHVYMETTGQWVNTPESSEPDQMEEVLQFVAAKMDIGFKRMVPIPDRLKIILALPLA